MSRGVWPLALEQLSSHEGQGFLTAVDAILKGVLESEVEISIIAGADVHDADRGYGAFSLLLRQPQEVHDMLEQQSTSLVNVASANRAISQAMTAARNGRAGIAMVANSQLDETVDPFMRLMRGPLERGAMLVMLENDPYAYPASNPVLAVREWDIPCVAPSDVGQLRDDIEHALRLSRAAKRPAALIVHEMILRSADTLELRPNRLIGSVDALLARRKRPASVRLADGIGPLRAARRLELNRFRSIPSPGERVTFGFITSGPADVSLQHITNALGLHGRVPVLQLGLIHPVDESAVGRMLTRCQHVIVLEPRPGTVEASVLEVAEMLRRRGEQPALVWGRDIPTEVLGAGVVQTPLTTDEDQQAIKDASRSSHRIDYAHHLHPSIMVRRVAHLLHAIRPAAKVESQLQPAAPLSVAPPPVRSSAGAPAMMRVIKRMLTDVDQWLREHPQVQDDETTVKSALAIDGTDAAGTFDRVVFVETWDHGQFVKEGLAALVQAARQDEPWIFVVCESASQPIRDLERLARGAAPADAAERVKLESIDLNDRIALRDVLRASALADRLTVIIVRDGPPAKFDVAAVEQEVVETDRLGFEPRQRLVRPAEEVCLIRLRSRDDDQSIAASHSESDTHELKTELSMHQFTQAAAPAFRVHVRPLLEEVEVLRTRPPLMSRRDDASHRLPTPQPLHGKQSHWRAHLAGFRGDSPGPATIALCEAGRAMGYHVRCIHDATAIGTGRRAWSQVLFTQSVPNQSSSSLSAFIPYGEADVLIGLDEIETRRAIEGDPLLHIASPDRTHCIANVHREETRNPSELRDEDAEKLRDTESCEAAVSRMCAPSPRMLEDFASACRTWFHTDRVADIAMLGTAFQLGLAPVAVEAIERAIDLLAARGLGRSREAFEFGRRLAVDHELFEKPKDEREEILERLTRRLVLSLSRGGWGGGSRARNFSTLLKHNLAAMPGLAETEAGRVSRVDFVLACHRCRIWGGFDYVQRYADLVTRLYQADHGDNGRMLTRLLILPLAEVMLIRDPLFIAGMANSPEQRRSLRQRLNVKMARGDRIERRYLTRLEVIAFNRRFRADVRSSDWPARAVSALRRLMPHRWRGSRRDRELRDYVIDFIKRCIASAPQNYEQWLEPASRLHHYAAEDRLRGAALGEVRMLLEVAAPALQKPTEIPASAVP